MMYGDFDSIIDSLAPRLGIDANVEGFSQFYFPLFIKIFNVMLRLQPGVGYKLTLNTGCILLISEPGEQTQHSH